MVLGGCLLSSWESSLLFLVCWEVFCVVFFLIIAGCFILSNAFSVSIYMMTKCFFFFRPILENFFWKEPDTVIILSGFVGQGAKLIHFLPPIIPSPGGLTRWWAHFAPSCHQLETFSGWRASDLRRRPPAGQWAATGVSFTFCPSDILVPAFLSSFPENLAISTWVADWRQVTSFCHWLLDCDSIAWYQLTESSGVPSV